MRGAIGRRAGAVALAACTMLAGAGAASAAPFTFSTGSADNRIALAARPGGPEPADDFVLTTTTSLTGVAFTGLLPSGAPADVRIGFYAVFPTGSDASRIPAVPTRANSPADSALATRDSTGGNLTFSATTLAPSFTALNSVLNGINKKPNQTTGGEGSVTGQETTVNATFTTPLALPAGHYFLAPQVRLASGQFYWLSAPGPTGASDLQAWIRNPGLEPDWLRVGTDIVGGGTTFNAAFTLHGATCSPIAVAPDALPSATAGRAYDTTVSASGGTAPYAFAASGRVPPGMSLAPSGRLAGTPTQAGTFTFAVTATDTAGCTGSRSYDVDVAAAAPDTSALPATPPPVGSQTPPAPAITRARVSPRRFRLARGATITYTDSRAATTTLAVARVTTGHRAGRRCRAGRPRHGQRSCTRLVARGAFVHQDAGGAVRLRFHGRVGGRRLTPGRYRLRLTPRADGRAGHTVVLSFTVLHPA